MAIFPASLPHWTMGMAYHERMSTGNKSTGRDTAKAVPASDGAGHSDHAVNAANATGAGGVNVDAIIARLQTVDNAIAALKDRRERDSETLGDKILLFALPTVAGIVVGRIMQSVWTGIERRSIAGGNTKATTSLFASLSRTAISAAVAAITNQLSSMAAQSIVARHHR
ncbi:membrane associated protein [Bifidobacterium thermophilum]|uniref:Membrane associated protein n=2 Tax=Bifidobacterium thermophilum TaxID=33905 RepID=A0A2N3QFL9_9BIFI|nr:membrane associated protein [Bifidobacterium thermophilum]